MLGALVPTIATHRTVKSGRSRCRAGPPRGGTELGVRRRRWGGREGGKGGSGREGELGSPPHGLAIPWFGFPSEKRSGEPPPLPPTFTAFCRPVG